MAEELAIGSMSGSFDLVEKEISHTLEQAEASLDRFQENRDSEEDLKSCTDCLSQLRGIYTLIELQGGMILCEESLALLSQVQVGEAKENDPLLAALVQALFVLRRYADYFDKRREDHPELLLDAINRLRRLRQADPLPDSHFFVFESSALKIQSVSEPAPDVDDFDTRSRRLRHMYQVGLLNLLKSTEQEIGFQLLARASAGLLKLSRGSSLSVLWELTGWAAVLMLRQQMSVTPSRQRLFMMAEKYAKDIAKEGRPATSQSASEALLRELIYIIATSGDRHQKTLDLLACFKTEPYPFDDAKKRAHHSLLMGPGTDVLSSLATALREEINQLKDKLDIIERGIDAEENSLEQMGSGLQRLADTLLMLDLIKLSTTARQLQTKLEGWSPEKRKTKPSNSELLAIADSLLSIEQAVCKLEEEGLTIETDKRAGQKASLTESPYLNEAMVVVLEESQSSISLAKRSITAYLESQGDGLHLDNVLPGLEAVTGALAIIGQQRAAKALGSTSGYIEEKLVNGIDDPDESSLDTLADALTSLEYFTDSLNRSSGGNTELLALAEESVKSLGF